MTREELTQVLKQRSGTAAMFAKQLGRSVAAVEEDLEHIRTSIRTDPEFVLLMQPAQCKLCGFVFPTNKAKAPTKCPECKREKLQPPNFKINRK